jgi:hypothetical protein
MSPPVISPTGSWIVTAIFVIIFLAALVLFGLRVSQLITLLVKARREDRTDHIDDRIGEVFLVVLGQSGVLRDPIPGIAHFFTFWGFIVVQFGLLNLMLGAFNGSLPLLGGNHTFAAVLDAFVIFVIIALVIFAIRRGIVRPKQLSSFLHGPWDGYIILGLILLVVVTLALVESFEYAAYAAANGVAAANNSGAWTPIGSWLYPLFSGLNVVVATNLYRVFWWLHILTVLGFLIYLPRSKHLHLMATPFNVFFRSYAPKGALPLLENLEEREDYGVSRAEQFTWKQLLDGYACTECGRCNTVCPQPTPVSPSSPRKSSWASRKPSSYTAMKFLAKTLCIASWGLPESKPMRQKTRKKPITSQWLAASLAKMLCGPARPVALAWRYVLSPSSMYQRLSICAATW